MLGSDRSHSQRYVFREFLRVLLGDFAALRRLATGVVARSAVALFDFAFQLRIEIGGNLGFDWVFMRLGLLGLLGRLGRLHGLKSLEESVFGRLRLNV